jgi:DNA-binding transcriptional LysR family regulator
VHLGITSYCDPRTLTSSILNGTADIAFVLDDPIESDRLVTRRLGSERILIVCSPHHPLARAAGGVTSGELSVYQGIFSDKSCAALTAFKRTMEAAGGSLPDVIEVGSVDAVKRCAVSGLGFGVLPSFAVVAEVAAGDLTAVPVRDLEMTLEAQTVRSAEGWVSPAVRALWDMVPQTAAMSSAA